MSSPEIAGLRYYRNREWFKSLVKYQPKNDKNEIETRLNSYLRKEKKGKTSRNSEPSWIGYSSADSELLSENWNLA